MNVSPVNETAPHDDAQDLVIEDLIAKAPAGARASFYRTSTGAEIDLVLELGARERWAVEVKRSMSPAVAPGFHIGCEDIGATRRIVVYPGAERFPLRKGIEVMGLVDAMAALRKHAAR